jgi:2-polyprenyl-3-methyl-5-hydroxy-6-metoxy-1,4-benzoquinol methylase
MHAKSKKEYVKFKKLLQLKFDSKLQSRIFNQFQNLQLDFVVQMIFNEN